MCLVQTWESAFLNHGVLRSRAGIGEPGLVSLGLFVTASKDPVAHLLPLHHLCKLTADERAPLALRYA